MRRTHSYRRAGFGAFVLIAATLAGCATLPPEGFGTVHPDAMCPAGTVKVCERPASELICRCQP